MNTVRLSIEYQQFDSAAELGALDQAVLEKARAAIGKAYAPYSRFNVGAAALLANNEWVEGSNQENASFPAGLCAERVLLSTLSSLYPSTAISTMAISYQQPGGISTAPIAPCGICRQTLQEYENRMGQPIRLILAGMQGQVLVFASASDLLPMAFSKNAMK